MISPGQAAFSYYFARGPSATSAQIGQVWQSLSPEARAFWDGVAKAAIARHLQNQAEDTKEIPLVPEKDR